MRPRTVAALASLLVAACRTAAPPAPQSTSVRVVSTSAPLTCVEWRQRALAQPELDVDRVPEPLAYDPAPIPKRLPAGVVDRNGRAEVRIQVLVDTLGKADMRTFRVVRSTSPKLTASVRAAVAKWTFRPAEVGGCKVPRTFNWGATAGGGRRG